MLSERFTQHIRQPKNMGDMYGFNGVGEVTGDECGDMMTVFIKVRDGLVAEISFKTFGCWAAVAAASLITETVKGCQLKEIDNLKADDFIRDLGDMFQEKKHCLELVIDAVGAAITNYLKNSIDSRSDQ